MQYCGRKRQEETLMGLEELLREKRQEILEIAAKHGAYNVRIFGSVARGEADEKSDVDFLIDAGPKRTPFFPGGMVVDLQNLLGRPVDVVTEKGLRSRIRERVLKEAVPL
jgi:predicted nucleotidyltransferase